MFENLFLPKPLPSNQKLELLAAGLIDSPWLTPASSPSAGPLDWSSWLQKSHPGSLREFEAKTHEKGQKARNEKQIENKETKPKVPGDDSK